MNDAIKIVALVFLGVISCRDDRSNTEEEDQSSIYMNRQKMNGTLKEEFVNIKVSVENDDVTEFSLSASASAYTIISDTCSSNYSDTATESSGNLRLYKYDRNCVGRLVSFTHNSQVYTPKGVGFDGDYSEGSTAVFENSDSSLEVTVEVSDQLSTPLVSGDTINYIYYDFDALSDLEILETTITSEQTEAGSPSIPNFNLAIIQLTDISNSEEADYEFSLECNVQIVSQSCDSVDFADLRYKLVEHPDPTTIDGTWLDNQFSSGQSSITLPDDVIPVSPPTTNVENGGFITETLTSHADIVNSSKFVFIIQHYHASDPSYRYFELSIALTGS